MKAQQLLMAAIPVALGIILLNNLKQVAGNTVVGKVIDGSLLRRAG